MKIEANNSDVRRSRAVAANRRAQPDVGPIARPALRREATPEISQPRCGWNRPNKIPPSCRDAGPRPTAASPAPAAINDSSFPLTLDFGHGTWDFSLGCVNK
jgi:hypothetical protein